MIKVYDNFVYLDKRKKFMNNSIEKNRNRTLCYISIINLKEIIHRYIHVNYKILKSF